MCSLGFSQRARSSPIRVAPRVELLMITDFFGRRKLAWASTLFHDECAIWRSRANGQFLQVNAENTVANCAGVAPLICLTMIRNRKTYGVFWPHSKANCSASREQHTRNIIVLTSDPFLDLIVPSATRDHLQCRTGLGSPEIASTRQSDSTMLRCLLEQQCVSVLRRQDVELVL